MPGPFLGRFAAQTQSTLKNASSAGRLLSRVHTLHIRLLAATTKSLGTEGAHFEKTGKETRASDQQLPRFSLNVSTFQGLRTLDSDPQPPLCGKAHHGRWGPRVPSVPGPISLDVARGNKHPLLTDDAELETITSHRRQVAL